MSHGTNPVFGDAWRDLVRQRDDAGSSPDADAMKAAEFDRAVHLSMTAQNLLAQSFSRHLTAINLPTPADVF